jgi:uncharacterized protein YndB with AHSA1/START domain
MPAMATREIEASGTTSADPAAVWALLADVSTWTGWGEWDAAGLDREAPAGGEGVGAVRRLRLGRTVSVEEITAFEPPARLGYRLVGGNLPVRDYAAEVLLTPGPGGGTEITWRSSFRGRLPGVSGIVARRLQPFLADAIERLGRAAERHGA